MGLLHRHVEGGERSSEERSMSYIEVSSSPQEGPYSPSKGMVICWLAIVSGLSK